MKNIHICLTVLILNAMTSMAQNLEELPLFSMSQLTYEGAFRIRAAAFGDSDMNFSQGPIAYNAQNHSLFVVGHAQQQAIAEFAIPELVKSEIITDLNMAETPIQPFSEVLFRINNPQDINTIGGLYVVNTGTRQKLIVNAFEYYDAAADNTVSTLILEDANNLESSTIKGFLNFENGVAHASGWISPIPEDLQTVYEGTHIAGHSSGMPIISRLSVGPSAFVFQMDEALTVDNTIPTRTLLDFSLDNALNTDLYNETLENDIWTHITRANYGFIVPGTRTYLTIGSSGGHETGVCYKCTQDNGNLCGGYCAPGANDYDQYYWLWDLNDLLDVKNGTRSPYEIMPYDYGPFNTPFSEDTLPQIGGGSFDPATGNLYLSVQKADTQQGQFANPPVIVAYNVNGPISDEPEIVLVENEESAQITVYPNPTATSIAISGMTTESRILITDVRHKVLRTVVTTENNVEIDLSSFAVGLYFVSIENQETGELITKKIIKR